MRWIYHVEPVNFPSASTKEIEEQLNKLGDDGWEAAAAIPVGDRGIHAMVFKRENSK
jgi:hypothetical protein